MRESKHRGKRVDNGEWIYGSLITPTFDNSNNIFGYYIYELNKENLFTTSNSQLENMYEIRLFLVDPKTIGGYTGLNDKNGTEMYKGDIVDNSYINPMSKKKVIQRYIIEWENGLYRMKYIGKNRGYDRYLWMHSKEVEVIGNVDDNPNLLEN